MSTSPSAPSLRATSPMKGPALSRFKVFILEPDLAVLDYLRSTLESQYDLNLFGEDKSLLATLEQGTKPDLFLLAWQNSADTLPLLSTIQAAMPRVPVVVLSCSAELETLITATRVGARAIVLKPFLGNDLEIAMDEHLAGAELQAPDDAPKEIALNETHSFVRSSKRMCELESQAALVARADIPLLILGESGTGKEILALYTHKMSARSQETFLKVNCAAMPGSLIESELFGYEQGAFTGAHKTKQGKFEMCDGGTIFLDEIGEMPATLQAKLLHVLQDGTFWRLGSRSAIHVDVRVIAATNIDMREAIERKTFREDLYYRLSGFTLRLPPLRERREEVPVLADYFMRKAARRHNRAPLPFSQNMMGALTDYGWPGNLRELENIINRYLVLGNESAILNEIAPWAGVQQSQDTPGEMSGGVGLKRLVRSLKGDAESTAIAQVLEETGWNRKAAARHLQISYKALLYKIKQYNLVPPNAA